MKGNYNEENTHVYYNVVMKFDGGINISKPPWRGMEHVTEVAGFVPPYMLKLKMFILLCNTDSLLLEKC